jgi:integrase
MIRFLRRPAVCQRVGRHARSPQMSLPMSVLDTCFVGARDDDQSGTSIIPEQPFSRMSSPLASRRAKSPTGQLELIFFMAALDPFEQHASAVPQSSAFAPGQPASPAHACPPPTIAELIERLHRHPTLAPRRLRDMVSALRTICRLADLRPDLIPATATQIRIIFTGSSPVTAGICKARWHNLRSLAFNALRHAGLPAIKGQTRQPLSPAWDALRDRLPTVQSRAGLSRFMSYCSARQIDPPQVTETTFNNFAEALRSGTLGKEPAQLFQTTCRRWNAAVAEIEGWPPTIATVPNRSRRYAFDLTAFPGEFQADVAAFLACTGNQDPFAEDYAPSVKPSTIAMRRKQIAQMATALAQSGIEIEAIKQLATLVEPDNAKSILRYLRDRHGNTFTYLHQQALLLKTIARYWVKAPEDQIERISRVAQNLAVKRRAMTPKNSRRLRQFDSEENLRALLDLPDRVLAEARGGTKMDARRVMLALAVGLLTVTAMRIDNLAGLEPDRHLVRSGRNGATATLLIIPAEETKTNKPIEAELSPAMERLLTTYQRDYLPLLAVKPGGGLFLSRNGERCRTDSLATMVGRFIKREIGLEVNPHLFRHLAAKLVLKDDPTNIETARQLLGHSSTTTTERAYTDLRTAPAYELYQRIVSGHQGSRSLVGRAIPHNGVAQ